MFLPSNITLQLGDNGDFVAELQRRLVGVKSLSEDAVTGSYDGRTVNGVMSFQMRCGIRADGVAGPETLRRLNAVMAGGSATEGTAGGGGNQEEEAARAAANVNLTYRMMEEQALSPQGMPMGVLGAAGLAAGAAALGAESSSAMPEAHTLQQQLMKESQQFQQQQGQSYDQIAQTLQQQNQMLQQQLMQQQAQMNQMMAAQAPQSPQADPSLQPPTQPGAGFGAKPPVAQGAGQSASVQGAEPEQKQGILGKAMAKMDAMLQKLASYFEAKLPPDVLSEVKHLGAVMAASGVKENRLPEAPDQVRAQATPARAPEPMQTPQRN
jgi:murein L,D-transpeptidase YcbB/YkuD